MKVLIIVPSYKPAYVYGGPIRSIAQLAESLTDSGQHVNVYTTNANGEKDLAVDTEKEYIVANVLVRYFKRWIRGHMNFSPGLLLNVFKSCDTFDIVHIQSWWNPIAVLSTLICYFKGVVPIISPRGSMTAFTFEHRHRFFKKCIHLLIGKRLLQKSVIHVTSVQELEEVQKYINTQKIYVVPNILELPMRIYGFPEPDNILKLVFVGRIDPAKNLEMLFKALQAIGKTSFILHIIGEGKKPYEEKLKKEAEFSSNIIWHGNLDGEDKYKIIAKSDLLVMPSLTENFGNVVIESLSQGTPVLISNQVGAKDFVDKFELGWIVELNTNKWSTAILEIWNQKEQLNAIRLKAPEIISYYFKPEKIIQNYLDVYAQLK